MVCVRICSSTQKMLFLATAVLVCPYPLTYHHSTWKVTATRGHPVGMPHPDHIVSLPPVGGHSQHPRTTTVGMVVAHPGRTAQVAMKCTLESTSC